MLDVLLKKSPARTNLRVIAGRNKSDKPLKSILKAVSWRIVGTLDTIIISYIITGQANLALSIGTMELLTKTLLYYLHERAWARISLNRILLWFKPRRKYDIKGIK